MDQSEKEKECQTYRKVTTILSSLSSRLKSDLGAECCPMSKPHLFFTPKPSDSHCEKM